MKDRPSSLREYVDVRFASQEKAVDAALISASKAVDAALAAAEKAVNKAEANAEKWRDNANEWRGAMGDRERDFLTRREFYVMVATAVIVIGAVMAAGR